MPLDLTSPLGVLLEQIEGLGESWDPELAQSEEVVVDRTPMGVWDVEKHDGALLVGSWSLELGGALQ